jgi:hypothetical protein
MALDNPTGEGGEDLKVIQADIEEFEAGLGGL